MKTIDHPGAVETISGARRTAISTYIDHYVSGGVRGRPPICVHDWQAFTRERLSWLYGPNHATERQAMTQADLARWNALGAPRSAA